LNYKPSSKNSKIHVRAKINYVCSKCNSELISFRLLRKIKGNSQPLVLMNDCSLGSFFGVTNYNIYNLEYIDTPSTLNEITYYLNYKIHNSNNNINNKSGILGYDLSNHNFFCAQEIYIPEIEQYCSDTYINQDLNYNYPIIIIGTAGNNTMFYSINNSKTWISLGKTIFEEGVFTSILVVKGGADEGDNHAVDGISGGTITSDGVSDMLKERLERYLPYFDRIRPEIEVEAIMSQMDTVMLENEIILN